jgi:hypothetical protein
LFSTYTIENGMPCMPGKPVRKAKGADPDLKVHFRMPNEQKNSLGNFSILQAASL